MNVKSQSTPSTPFDREGQKVRREHLLALCRQENFPRYDAQGKWLLSVKGGDEWRDRVLQSYAFYMGNKAEIALANTILMATPDDLNDFSGHHAAALLGLHEEKMSDAVRQKLIDSLAYVNDHAYRHLFRYTENCGLLNVLGLLEANRRFNRPHYRDKSLRFLEVFCRFLEKGNVCKEYLSVNYFGVTLGAAGLLRQLSPDPECTEMTARIESMLWDELALLWHPKLFLSGAASGRSYTPNSIPVVSGLTTAAWMAYGDAATPSPAALGLFSQIGSPEALASGCVEWDLPFWQVCLAWLVAPEYLPTQEQYRATVEKSFPYSMTAKSVPGSYREHEILPVSKKEAGELGGWWGGGASDVGTAYVPSTVLRSGGESILTSHMTPDLGLGTATRQMCRSSNFCFGAWRRAPKVEKLADTRTLFMRYVINDQVEKAFLAQEQGNIDDNGRGGAAQSGPMAVAWYAGDEVETTGIKQLKTCAIFSLWHGNDFDEVLLGDSNCPTLEGSSDTAEWVFLRDGETYIGLHPLLLTQHGSEKVVEIKKVGCFRVVSFANYDGAPRDFFASALRQTGGGALVCMGSAAEYPGGFTAFRESCRTISIVDEGYQCQRHIHAKWGNREVELLMDMQTMELLWARTEETFLAP